MGSACWIGLTSSPMWRDLAPDRPVRRPRGGYFRQPLDHAPSASCAAWFREQAAARGLELEADGLGNLVAWWRPDSAGRGAAAGGVLTGSHLDSVLDGGAYDGPLGVVSALAAIDLLRERGVDAAAADRRSGRSSRRRGRASGSPAWARGWPPARPPGRRPSELRDRDGVLAAATRWRPRPARPDVDGVAGLGRQVGCFVELHVEQGRDLVDRGVAGRGGERDLAARPLPLRLRRARPTTPARPGWRTGTTRCSATR